MKTKKHLVYVEDFLYEIMQYPSKSLSKGLIRKCADEVIKEKEVSIWKYIQTTLFGKVHRNYD